MSIHFLDLSYFAPVKNQYNVAVLTCNVDGGKGRLDPTPGRDCLAPTGELPQDVQHLALAYLQPHLLIPKKYECYL